MFGRATITLGIGPHSSLKFCFSERYCTVPLSGVLRDSATLILSYNDDDNTRRRARNVNTARI